MLSILDPNDMSPEDILSEVASLLAKGYWRHYRQCAASHLQRLDSAEDSVPLTAKELDFPGRRSKYSVNPSFFC